MNRRRFTALTAAGTCIFPGIGNAARNEWQQLNRQVEAKQQQLGRLIKDARRRGCVVDYAVASYQVIGLFIVAANHDYANRDRAAEIFAGRWHYRKMAPEYAVDFPIKELNSCIDVADYAITQLQQQMAGKIRPVAPPDLTKGTMKLAPKAYELEGRRVFPSSLVWTPARKEELNCFGRIGGAYLQIPQLQEDGTPGRQLQSRIKSFAEQDAFNMAPRVFLTGHNTPGWMKEKHPEVLYGGRNFTTYDIDSPLIREWIQKLYSGMLPEYAKACEAFPMVHLLANEPHFATRKGGWKAENGLSDCTMQKWQQWLADKYAEISALNTVYGTEYSDWDQVLFQGLEPKQRLMDQRLRGTPLWYDWVRFNHDRVNEWFTFLKTEAQKNDNGRKAPVSIKVLGYSLSKSERDGGMDMEYLTDLQEVMGADLRCAPQGAQFFGKHEEGMDPKTGWKAHFAYEWSEQSMFLDWSKSMYPEKVFYDSEWHGFSSVSWRHFNMSRDYVRSALWLAFTHGMGMINAWLWGRRTDGSLNPQGDHIGELSNQPIAVDAFSRTMKELNAHAQQIVDIQPEQRDFWIYYCEEAAIQDETYTHGMQQVYEALKLLNFTVGFTTPSKIDGLDPETQTVIVPPTAYILDESLNALKSFSGRLVLVGGEESFVKNEHGAPRSNVWKPDGFAAIPKGDWPDLLKPLETALRSVATPPLLPVRIEDAEGHNAIGVNMFVNKDTESGRVIVALNNISKDPRVVLLPDEAMAADLITQQRCANRISMAPCDVRLLMIA
ncbi:alpha-amylase family protein [Pontiella agarivorans]|uniref:Beta-galactosidase n=1 Tax=Pontiella agarivorans TaxID=3038953 RepID=A0ABU5MTT7_9BACT|nr:alpha-amylase family protein [Pontiella agarivorans]MDZ8117621.1 beta-galactosidase [Pontiella agarivorans]